MWKDTVKVPVDDDTRTRLKATVRTMNGLSHPTPLSANFKGQMGFAYHILVLEQAKMQTGELV